MIIRLLDTDCSTFCKIPPKFDSQLILVFILLKFIINIIKHFFKVKYASFLPPKLQVTLYRFFVGIFFACLLLFFKFNLLTEISFGTIFSLSIPYSPKNINTKFFIILHIWYWISIFLGLKLSCLKKTFTMLNDDDTGMVLVGDAQLRLHNFPAFKKQRWILTVLSILLNKPWWTFVFFYIYKIAH